MKKYLSLLIFITFFIPGIIHATPFAVGDELKITLETSVNSGFGTLGGLFKIKNLDKNIEIYSFCLELDEYVSYAKYVFDADDDIVWKGGKNTNDGDQISGSTKWLYSQYLSGTFSDVQALQLAIWYLEDEYNDVATDLDGWKSWYISKTNNSALADKAGDYITQALLKSDYTNSGILALDTYDGGSNQGQSYIFNVPEPSTLLLLGAGLLGLGIFGRKRFRKR
jgi:hypothetical protein